MAELAARLRGQLRPDELAELLPSPDAVVRACLDALPEAGPLHSHRARLLLNSCALLRSTLRDQALRRDLDRLLALTHEPW